MVKTVGIVSLSSGVIGERFVKHEIELGVKRLKEFGMNVKFLPNAQMGMNYLREHPDKRAGDLLRAFCDPEIDMILCAIGGEDTYKLIPYLFDNNELQKVAANKIFLGFSDTTINHFMLYKVGIKTFYGQAFLPDICELSDKMLPYTYKYFSELISTGGISEITPSDIWYESRTNFDKSQIGVPLKAHKNNGFELLQGKAQFCGEILGGCIDSIFDIFDGTRNADMPEICRKYEIFPRTDEWRGKILLLETSEELMQPQKFKKALEYLKATGIFEVISGILVGKPMDEVYHEEYKKLLIEVINNSSLSIVCNINIGHAMPRCIIPFGVKMAVDADNEIIRPVKK